MIECDGIIQHKNRHAVYVSDTNGKLCFEYSLAVLPSFSRHDICIVLVDARLVDSHSDEPLTFTNS